MKVSALDPDARLWTVMHIPTATIIRDCVWADDETHQYARGLWLGDGRGNMMLREESVIKARKIIISKATYFILIDPVEDADQTEESKQHENDSAVACQN